MRLRRENGELFISAPDEVAILVAVKIAKHLTVGIGPIDSGNERILYLSNDLENDEVVNVLQKTGFLPT